MWVLASETHLTGEFSLPECYKMASHCNCLWFLVLFSEFKQLVNEETQPEKARRTFKEYDPEGFGFIPTILLEDIFRSLDLVSEPG